MQIRYNGEVLSIADDCTLAGLIAAQGLTGKRIAVERNGEIVPRSQHAHCQCAAGDIIEVVHAIGGG
ncbi:MAG: sulfur carrier protein ThiS [Pseudomonadota bacterium]